LDLRWFLSSVRRPHEILCCRIHRLSPVIHSVKPRVLRSRGRDATVTLRGGGFIEDSEVKFGDQLGASAATNEAVSEVEIRDCVDQSLFPERLQVETKQPRIAAGLRFCNR
jgi:hypothetical protein